MNTSKETNRLLYEAQHELGAVHCTPQGVEDLWQVLSLLIKAVNSLSKEVEELRKEKARSEK